MVCNVLAVSVPVPSGVPFIPFTHWGVPFVSLSRSYRSHTADGQKQPEFVEYLISLQLLTIKIWHFRRIFLCLLLLAGRITVFQAG